MTENQRNAAIAGLLLGTLSLLPAWADSPADRFAGQIQQYREAATAARESLASVMAEARQVPAFSKVDGPLITAHLEAVAQTWTEAAAALEKGEGTAGTNLAQRAQEMAGQRDRWQERLRWRSRQAQQNEYMPACAEVFITVAADRSEEDVQELAALMEAKKRRSEAYGRLAEATTPAAAAKILFQLQDEAFAADVEVGVAEMRLPWANEDWGYRKFLATDPTITSPELTAANQRLAEWRRQREETYRQSRRQQYALEQLDRESRAVVAAREHAYQAAKAARELRKNGNQVVTPASGVAVTVPLQEVARVSRVDPAVAPGQPSAAEPHLPLPWRQGDIGPVKESGSGAEDKSVFTVRGAGWGIWGAADSFHFVYQPLVGDGDTVARLGDLPDEETPFVAGLTIRESMESNSIQASVMMFPEGKLRMSCRPVDGSAEAAPPAGTKPYQWVRLVRAGDAFSGFCSPDGVAWVLVGTVRVKMSVTAHVGLACAATLNQGLMGTMFDQVKVTAQAMGPSEGLGLVDGSLVAGRAKSLDGQALKYTDADGIERSLPAEAVAYLFTRPLPPDVRKVLAERKEGVSLVTGDEMEGSVQGLRDGRLTVASLILGQQTPALSKVLTAVLRPVKPSGSCSVSTRDGSIYRCKEATVGDGVVTAEGGIAGMLRLKAADVVAVNRAER